MNKELCPQCYSEVATGQYPDKICPKCKWTGHSDQTINEYTVTDVELNRIWSDDDFNCRGIIVPMDVIDLAKDIDRNGLQFPIAVQPINEVVGGGDSSFDFRIVARLA